MKTNTLKYTVVKSFREKGITYKVITTIKLHDECKNGTCSWSITGILQQKKGNGCFYDIGHGCIHEEILKASPKLKMFVDLHLCDWRGTPLYPVETGYYFLQKDKKQAKEYLRVTDEEMEGKILSGYYTESAIQERKEAERIAKIEKRKNEVIKTFEKRINKATKEKDVKLAILGAGLLSDNYIYYVEGNNVVFNYYSYHDKVTEEEYNNMLKNKLNLNSNNNNRTMSITDFYNGRFVSGKILKRDYRIIWQRIVIATAALCGMFIFMMAIQLMCWLSNLCNYVFR